MAMRTFRAPDDRTWDVWAVVPTSTRGAAGVPEGFGDGWLCFESGGLKRRLAGIPAGWETAEDERLLLLWRAAAEVAPRRPPRRDEGPAGPPP